MGCVIHAVEQRSADWFSLRAGLLTASDAAALAMQPRKGQSESVTRSKLVFRLALERITGRSEARDFDTPAMQRGRELEAEALAAYEAFAEGMTADGLILQTMQRIPAPEKPLEAHVRVGAGS